MSNEKIQSIIHNFLQHLGVRVDAIDIEKKELHPVFVIRTPDSKILIGTGGENLRALNYIVRKMVERNTSEECKFLIDVNGYHERKLNELRQQARILAERARTFRHDVELSPMNAYERMIIHSLIGEDPELTTESQGEGKFRRVVIRYNAAHESSAGARLD